MFNSKYNKALTVILVLAIIIIVGLLIYVGIGWYKAYTTNVGTADGLEQFDDYVNNIISNTQTNNQENTAIVEPNIDVNNTIQNVNTNSSGNGNSSGSTTNRPMYKGFYMVGKIEIPKTNVKLPVLEKANPKSIEASVAVLYGPGINKVGNTVIIGHNYRNGTFFSNNKKLELDDKIYLTDLEGKKVTYTIYKKYETGTEDFDYAVRDTKGKREISLSTCTDDSKKRLIIWAKED